MIAYEIRRGKILRWVQDECEHVYTINPGESVALLTNGAILVTHPDYKSLIIRVDGEMVVLG